MAAAPRPSATFWRARSTTSAKRSSFSSFRDAARYSHTIARASLSAARTRSATDEPHAGQARQHDQQFTHAPSDGKSDCRIARTRSRTARRDDRSVARPPPCLRQPARHVEQHDAQLTAFAPRPSEFRAPLRTRRLSARNGRRHSICGAARPGSQPVTVTSIGRAISEGRAFVSVRGPSAGMRCSRRSRRSRRGPATSRFAKRKRLTSKMQIARPPGCRRRSRGRRRARWSCRRTPRGERSWAMRALRVSGSCAQSQSPNQLLEAPRTASAAWTHDVQSTNVRNRSHRVFKTHATPAVSQSWRAVRRAPSWSCPPAPGEPRGADASSAPGARPRRTFSTVPRIAEGDTLPLRRCALGPGLARRVLHDRARGPTRR